jgi:hypothetical protein
MKQLVSCEKGAVAFLLCAGAAMAGSGPTFTILTTFPTGVFPGAPPVQGTDGNFYGTAAVGIYPAPGTIYRVTPEGC